MNISPPNEKSKIFVAGHTGLVGSAVCRALESQGFSNVIVCSRGELDLSNKDATEKFFNLEKPEYVILAAAKVGGIVANSTYPADFIETNLAIQANVFKSARKVGVKRLIFMGSSCIYPKDAPQPIKEEYLLTGPLEVTNKPFALAKISGIEMCSASNRQFGTAFLTAMSTNLYGYNDNYHPQNSHVLPALIRRFHEAKQENASTVFCWGSGMVRREFLFCDDLAKALIRLLTLDNTDYISLLNNTPPIINIGSGSDVTIKELAELAAEVTGYTGKIEWDTSKPDGTKRKLLDATRIKSLGWEPIISLREGMAECYQDFLEKL